MDHPERELLVTSAFLRDFQHMSGRTVRFIISAALDVTYAQTGRQHIGAFPVYTPDGAHAVGISAEPVPGQPNTYRLEGEEGLLE